MSQGKRVGSKPATSRVSALRRKHVEEVQGNIREDLDQARKAALGSAIMHGLGPNVPEFEPAGDVIVLVETITLVPIEELIPLDRNPRVHSDRQIEDLVQLIRTVGFLVPVIVDKKGGKLAAGHARLAAARRLGLERVPTIYADHLTPAQIKAFVIADNQVAARSTWSEEILAEYFRDLKAAGTDPTITTFTAQEIDAILAEQVVKPLEVEQGIPSESKKPATKTGDLWILGTHRVLCGDATVVDDVLKLLDDRTMDALVTDTPALAHPWTVGDQANLEERELAAILTAALGVAFVALDDGAPAYVIHREAETHIVRRVFAEVGFRPVSALVWKKPDPERARGPYAEAHLPIAFGQKPGDGLRLWVAPRSTVIDLDYLPFVQVGENEWSVTVGDRVLGVVGKDLMIEISRTSLIEKPREPGVARGRDVLPVSLLGYLLDGIVHPGGRVLDPFAGSGSTLLACEGRGVSGYMLEVDAARVDVIVRRWQTATGATATLASSGRTFDQVARGRKKGD